MQFGRWFRDLFREFTVEEGTERIRNFTRRVFSDQNDNNTSSDASQEQTSPASSFFGQQVDAFSSGWLPNATGRAQSIWSGLVSDLGLWLTQEQKFNEHHVGPLMNQFAQSMNRLREKEPWRINLFKSAVARHPSGERQMLILWYAFDALDDDERWMRICEFISEKPALTKFGEWLRKKGITNWKTVRDAVAKFFTETLPEIYGKMDEYLEREVAPRIAAVNARMIPALDAAATRTEQRSRGWL